MNVKELINVIVTGYKVKRPVLALSSPGIGKSSAVYQAASKLSKMYGEIFSVIEVRASTANPSELGDIKFVVNGEVRDAKQSWVPSEGRGIIFLDEISDSTPTVQSALQQLLLDRRLGSAHLGEGWSTVGASNRQSDKAAAGRLSTALVNRCLTVTIIPDTDCFIEWGIENTLAPEVLAYTRWRPSCWNFDPKSRNENLAFCSPRSMHMMSDWLKVEASPSIEITCGIIGDGVGAEFRGFLDIMRELPDRTDVINNPTTTPISERFDVALALIYSLVSIADESNMNNILTYLSRNNKELAIMSVRDLIIKDKGLTTRQPAFRLFVTDPSITRILLA